MAHFVTTRSNGSVSGSVWHSSKECTGVNFPAQLVEVDEPTLRLLGFAQCRSCMRIDLFAEDDVLMMIAEALRKAGFVRENLGHPTLLSAANNMRKALLAEGLQLPESPKETHDR